ncbi:bifunctional salicylyl-CoA 5-hydroxylase/oxidoreductase [Marivibrio halodurans]|uniref:Bifunctional salicylyl-CoA 5-hydroxylase/oxidoreductase n=1 Tax=Marivibrio halodurans TaxID=2039722 RepID=A0A8J7V428_9PROT|nr:bifunctional salicylyl-CoA 5-hydroxylase/oxidoreductase [Marivibrio halodurans]MBP5857239.1 bifunctional salicylyl-CoA 5-hydroxylase/oxidoreductase [Marivibrio halodurans]
MKITCIGGGPAGLYFAILMKLQDDAHDITVVERNRPYDTFGWGVVLSDETMDNLRDNDPVSAETILSEFAHWDDIDVHYKGACVTSGGHGFSGIGRKRLLNILQARAEDLGIALQFETEVEDIEAYADSDLIIAADGINSKVRNRFADVFEPDIDVRRNKFVWLGTHKVFDAFTFIFEETEAGWIWAHAYKFDGETSTFIVECAPETWARLGLDTAVQEETIRRCEEIFRPYLDGHGLMSNARHLRGSAWLNFQRVSCKRWRHGNIVLMGDAAHTAHFSIGSGTKLAMEDAIDLAAMLKAGVIEGRRPLDDVLKEYQEARRLEVLRIQSAARNSTEWFEDIERYFGQDPIQFAYSLLTRSQRVSHENLRLRDRAWLEGAERWFVGKATGRETQRRVPPMFAPFRLRDMELVNRVAVSPMSMYSATDGLIDDFHLIHYGARAQGGAGLIFTEMTDVSAEGRITPGCAGLYTDAHEAAWTRVVDAVHRQGEARICLQLGHAGPKGSTQRGWERMDAPLPEGNWEIIAPSAVPWSPENQVPRAMTRADMDRVTADFVAATERAARAGFDMLELHYAHGYLMSAFITPLMNKRTDDYGGCLENRLRYPLEVFRAVRAVWPAEKPISVRISSNDWVGDFGITPAESVAIARHLKAAGVDIVDVSAGQTSPDAKPVYGRMFQTPFSDRIRNEVGIPTMAVGNIHAIDHVNSILMAGRADVCCLARPHLWDPYWTLKAAAAQGYEDIAWPRPYLPGKAQIERLMEKQQQADGGFRV